MRSKAAFLSVVAAYLSVVAAYLSILAAFLTYWLLHDTAEADGLKKAESVRIQLFRYSSLSYHLL